MVSQLLLKEDELSVSFSVLYDDSLAHVTSSLAWVYIQYCQFCIIRKTVLGHCQLSTIDPLVTFLLPPARSHNFSYKGYGK